MLCICGSKIESKKCCNEIVNANAQANTPLELMRSRYFAFAMGITDYLVASHSTLTRTPQLAQELSKWCSVTRWAKLVIHSFDKVSMAQCTKENVFTIADQRLPTVCFSAFYFYDNEFYMMKELSRFIIEDEQWRYLDGEALEHVNYGKLGANTPCPCNSGQKFKRCCKKQG